MKPRVGNRAGGQDKMERFGAAVWFDVQAVTGLRDDYPRVVDAVRHLVTEGGELVQHNLEAVTARRGEEA